MIRKWFRWSQITLAFLPLLLTNCGKSTSGGSTQTPTATFSASPSPIAAGQSSSLQFSSTNANQGTIDNGVGQVGINGKVTVSPTATTTYTFTATGPGGSTSALATVNVSPAPTVTIAASPASISMGQSSMLTVTAANATQVAITDNVDSTTYSLSASGGTQSVTPPSTAIYKATATGVNGATAQVTTTIDVIQPPPTVTLSASPAAVFDGQGSLLTWTSTNATSVVLNGIGVPFNGSKTISPSQTTTYNITATGNGQQATASATIAISPVNSFDGMAEDSTNLGETDIDPIGAVGTKQFLEYDNTEYQGYDKITHAPVWSSPQQIGTPWNGIQQCEGTSIQLDAVVLFDRMASRWVIGAKTTRQQPYYFCIAISNTDDLSSSSFKWFAYLFNLDPVLGTNSSGSYYRPDWPKIGTWWNAYYATMDLNDPDNAFQQSGIVACAFDRTGMLAGASQSALKAMQCFKDTSLMSNGVYIGHSLIPADFDGRTAPPAGRDEFMVSIQNPPLDGTSTTSSVFNLWDFHLDWTTPTNSKLTLMPQPSVDAYTPGCYTLSFPAATFCVPEPPAGGMGQRLDSVGDRFMPRFAYRNFGSYESFLVAHTVQTNLGTGQDATQTGIRWYELQGNGSGVDIPAVIHQGTITPDNNYFRFLPSIAEDNVGNAAVGYSVSNPSTNPAIDFSYWNLPNSTDPGEVTIYQGTGEEVSSGNGQGKWGSYSSMTVDPVDDCTFWYVNEYWPTDTAWSTRIAYFKVPGCQ